MSSPYPNPNSKQPSPLVLSKVRRSNSVSSLFIEEVNPPPRLPPPPLKGILKKPRPYTQSESFGNNKVNDMGLRRSWIPIDHFIDGNTIIRGQYHRSLRFSHPYLKWLCWTLIVGLILGFVALIAALSMTPASRTPSPVILGFETETTMTDTSPKIMLAEAETENTMSHTSPQIMLSCRQQLEMEHSNEICDMEIQCPDRSDELGCPCQIDSFYCNRFHENLGTECVNSSFVCDGVKDCQNGKDESHCITVSSNLRTIEPLVKPDSIEGYVLARLKGVWHPYCYNEWSNSSGLLICNHFGYGKLIFLKILTLGELYSMKNISSETQNLLEVAFKEDKVSNQIKTYKFNETGSQLWSSCRVIYLCCSISQSH